MNCEHCGKPHNKQTGEINRARNGGYRLFCSKKCSGLARRKHKTKAQKVVEKRLYDEQYRTKNLAMLKAKKAEYFRRTYDRVAAAKYRKSRMHKHVEYCRRPQYKAYKSGYDAQYRAKREYGEFWEAGMLLTQIDKEIDHRATYEELQQAKGTQNKSTQRKREYEKLIGGKSKVGIMGNPQ